MRRYPIEDAAQALETVQPETLIDVQRLQELEEARQEAADLVGLLKSRATELATTLDADFPDLRSSIWLSEAAAQTSVQSLTPQMTENRQRVRATPQDGGPTIS